MLRKVLFLLVLILVVCFAICASSSCAKKKNISQDIAVMNEFKSLEDVFVALDTIITNEEKEKIKKMTEKEFSVESHFTIGMWIRNNWIRDGRLPFISEWRTNGTLHMDDVSSIILVSYYRYLTNKDVDLEEQLKYYNNYSLVHQVPDKTEYPKGLNLIDQRVSYDYELKAEGLSGCLHLLFDKNENNIWLYDYYHGWKEINKEIVEDIDRNSPLTTDYVESLFLTKD